MNVAELTVTIHRAKQRITSLAADLAVAEKLLTALPKPPTETSESDTRSWYERLSLKDQEVLQALQRTGRAALALELLQSMRDLKSEAGRQPFRGRINAAKERLKASDSVSVRAKLRDEAAPADRELCRRLEAAHRFMKLNCKSKPLIELKDFISFF